MHDQGRHNRVFRVGEVVVINRNGTCGLTPKSDTLWVTAKVGNVVANPLKSEALVKEAEVLLVIGEASRIRLSKDAQAVSLNILVFSNCVSGDKLTECQQQCACHSSESIG